MQTVFFIKVTILQHTSSYVFHDSLADQGAQNCREQLLNAFCVPFAVLKALSNCFVQLCAL